MGSNPSYFIIELCILQTGFRKDTTTFLLFRVLQIIKDSSPVNNLQVRKLCTERCETNMRKHALDQIADGYFMSPYYNLK